MEGLDNTVGHEKKPQHFSLEKPAIWDVDNTHLQNIVSHSAEISGKPVSPHTDALYWKDIRGKDKRNNSSVLLVLVDTCLNMYRTTEV